MDSKTVNMLADGMEAAIATLRHSNMHGHDHSGLKKAERMIVRLVAWLNEGRPVTPSEMAKNTGVTLAAITHHLNSLEEQGFVKRTFSPDDRRVTYVELTPAGKELSQKMKREFRKRIVGMMEFLGEEESRHLLRITEKLSGYDFSEGKEREDANI